MLWARVATSPIIGEDGGFEGALAMVSDITEQKRTDAEVNRSREMITLLSRAVEQTADAVAELLVVDDDVDDPVQAAVTDPQVIRLGVQIVAQDAALPAAHLLQPIEVGEGHALEMVGGEDAPALELGEVVLERDEPQLVDAAAQAGPDEFLDEGDPPVAERRQREKIVDELTEGPQAEP